MPRNSDAYLHFCYRSDPRSLIVRPAAARLDNRLARVIIIRAAWLNSNLVWTCTLRSRWLSCKPSINAAARLSLVQ
jgi:hypothetical protein